MFLLLALLQNANIVMLLATFLKIVPRVLQDQKVGSLNLKIYSNLALPLTVVAATTSSTFITMSDLEEMVKQVISYNSSIAMSGTRRLRVTLLGFVILHVVIT